MFTRAPGSGRWDAESTTRPAMPPVWACARTASGGAAARARALSPRVAVPVHEKVLSEAGIRAHYGQLEQLGGPGTSFQVLDDGRPAEL